MTMASVWCREITAEDVMSAAQKRLDAEDEKRRRFAAGELGLDIYNFRPQLAEKGLTYE